MRVWAALMVSGLAVSCDRGPRAGRDGDGANRGDDAAPAVDIEGRVTVDGMPQGAVTVVVAEANGHAVAETTTDHEGRFAFPRATMAGDGERWVVAKLRDPVVGAAAAPASVGQPIELAVGRDSTALLDVVIELPPKAEMWSTVEVEMYADKLDGVPDAATRALPFVSTGTSEGAYVRTRVVTSHRTLRVMRGEYRLSASSRVEWGLTRDRHPPNWMTERAILRDGSVLRARHGWVHVPIEHDTVVRMIMVPDSSDDPRALAAPVPPVKTKRQGGHRRGDPGAGRGRALEGPELDRR